MRYRALDSNGDMTFGHSQTDFLISTPAAVGQAVETRLLLLTGEWFLDVTEGTPYTTEVLGTDMQDTYDLAIRDRILGTEGVVEIVKYSSVLDHEARALRIEATIDTIYGQVTVAQVL